MNSAGVFGSVLLCGAVFGVAPAWAAPDIEEVRVGVMAHNTSMIQIKNAYKEASPNLTGELLFARPAMLDWMRGARPFVSVSLNTGGDTSFLGAGLEWRRPIGAKWRFEYGVGVAVHNGKLDNPFRKPTPQWIAYGNEHVLYGTRGLLRLNGVLSRDIGRNLSLGLMVEHYSNAFVQSDGVNQATDDVGLRLAYRLGG